MTVFDAALGSGRTLHGRLLGEGRPLVLIHGALVDHQDWLGGPCEAVGDLGQLVLVDRPGHGESRRRRFESHPAVQAHLILEGLAAIGVERFTLVAHSFGALVAMAMAIERPAAVEALTLAAPIAFPEFRPVEHLALGPRATPVWGPIASEILRGTLDPAMLRLQQAMMFAPQAPPPDWLERFAPERILRPGRLIEDGEDSLSLWPLAPGAGVDVRQVAQPVEIIAGDQDKVADPNRHARRLAASLPRARLSMVPGGGHMIHHLSPAGLRAAVLRALGERLAA